MSINFPPIETLVPHKGDMCFWKNIEYLDEVSLICSTQTHLKANHPLKLYESLSQASLIEYGAQAVAVHGGALNWLGKATQESQVGFIASVRNVEFTEQDFLTSLLRVKAQLLIANELTKSYQFEIFNDQEELVCQGRVMIVHPDEEDL